MTIYLYRYLAKGAAMLALLLAFSAQVFAVDQRIEGVVDATSASERQIVISGNEYRVALSATITMPGGERGRLQDVRYNAIVNARLSGANDDVVELKVLAYP